MYMPCALPEYLFNTLTFQLVSSRLQRSAIATLTTSQGTVSISFDPRTVLAGIHGVSTIKVRRNFSKRRT